MNKCDPTILDFIWSILGLMVGSSLGFSLGYQSGKKRRS